VHGTATRGGGGGKAVGGGWDASWVGDLNNKTGRPVPWRKESVKSDSDL
jgi:hypothetical protein